MNYCRLCILFFFILVAGCRKGNGFKTPPLSIADTSAEVKYIGYFANGPYGTASGWVKVLLKDGEFSLLLQNVNISKGPDLHVYISKELSPVNFIDLGVLQSVSGTHVYVINGAPDFTQYRYVLIHCKLYNQLYGSTLVL